MVSNKLKILFVTSHWPFAHAYGAQQRVLHIAKLLSRIGEVSFVLVSPEEEDEEAARKTRQEFNVYRSFRLTISRPQDGLAQIVSARLRHEFDRTYMSTDWYEVTETDRSAMLDLVQKHDIVWVHTVRVANWFRIYRWPHTVLDVDDLPSRGIVTKIRSSNNAIEQVIESRRYLLWRRRERALGERFDALMVCSKEDARSLRTNKRTYVLPNGAAVVSERPRPDSGPPRVGFIGNCTYEPNQDGIQWFMREVWPSVRRAVPDAQLRLVGRGSQDSFASACAGTVGLGWLEDPGEEIASWSLMIVPIRLGSGTRVKMAEGFARKCPIVATTTGAFGYAVESGKEFLLADSAAEFTSACVRLLRDSELRQAIAERAYKRFLEEWTWDSFECIVRSVVQDVLSAGGSTERSSDQCARK